MKLTEIEARAMDAADNPPEGVMPSDALALCTTVRALAEYASRLRKDMADNMMVPAPLPTLPVEVDGE